MTCTRCSRPPRKGRKLCAHCWAKQWRAQKQYGTEAERLIDGVDRTFGLRFTDAGRQEMAKLKLPELKGLIADLVEQEVELRRLCARDA